MSLAEVKERALALPIEEQAELIQFLTGRLRCDDPDYQRLLARLIDDHDPSRWVKWDDLKEKLSDAP